MVFSFLFFYFFFLLPQLVLNKCVNSRTPVPVNLQKIKFPVIRLRWTHAKTPETLSTQINYMNNQIRLLILNIENTKNTIGSLSREINEFGNEINRLEIILNQRLQLILKRIPESYKRSVVSPFNLVLLSQNFLI